MGPLPAVQAAMRSMKDLSTAATMAPVLSSGWELEYVQFSFFFSLTGTVHGISFNFNRWRWPLCFASTLSLASASNPEWRTPSPDAARLPHQSLVTDGWVSRPHCRLSRSQPYFSLMIMEFTKTPLKIRSKITPFCHECCVRCTGWHLGVFKQVSMPSQCVTHKLSKELSKFFFFGGGSIFYIHNIIVY